MVTLEHATPAVASDDVQPTRRDRLAIPALVTAQAISSTGNQLTSIAIPWFVLVTTGSAARTGLVAVAAALPVIVAGVFGGAIVDRMGFKRASVIADIASGVTVALIPILYLLDVLAFWQLLVLTFLGALLDVPGWVARNAMIPGLSTRAGMPLERSNAAMQLSHTVATVAGPLAGGVLIASLGEANVLFLDAGSFAISALVIALLISYPRLARASASAAPAGNPFSESLEGVRFFLRDRFMTALVGISLLMNFLFAPLFAVVLPVHVRDTWGDPTALGALVAAIGAGSLLGTLAYGAIGPKLPRYPVFAAGAAGLPIGLWFVPLAPSLAFALAGTLVMGLALGPVNVLAMTILQERVPEELLGRVFGALSALSQSLAPLGILIAAFAIEGLNARTVIVAIATMLTAVAAFTVVSPSIRSISRPTGAIAGEESA